MACKIAHAHQMISCKWACTHFASCGGKKQLMSMSGRVGDLSEEQSKALATFKSDLAQEFLADDVRNDYCMLIDACRFTNCYQATYLRFLRARKFVVADALR